MKTAIKKKITIMLDEQVYAGLRARVGARGVGEYLSQLARPHVIVDDIEAGYKAMAKDSAREAEAGEWLHGTDETLEAENVWRF